MFQWSKTIGLNNQSRTESRTDEHFLRNRGFNRSGLGFDVLTVKPLQHADGKTVSGWAITGNEVNAAVLEPQKEFGVSRQSVKFCDDQRCLVFLGVIQRRRQLGSIAIRPLAAFHFVEFHFQNTVLVFNEPANDFALGHHSVAVQPLLVCAHPVIPCVLGSNDRRFFQSKPHRLYVQPTWQSSKNQSPPSRTLKQNNAATGVKLKTVNPNPF